MKTVHLICFSHVVPYGFCTTFVRLLTAILAAWRFCAGDYMAQYAYYNMMYKTQGNTWTQQYFLEC